MQETLQKNLGAFRKDMRDLVASFFEDTNNCSVLTYVKFHVFEKPGGAPIMVRKITRLSSLLRASA